MRRAGGRDRPNERPAIRMKHRQRPEISIRARHMLVHERADCVHVGVAMRNHHPLGPRRGSAGVVDRE